MGKLFGTDGIRGVVNQTLDAQLAFKVGQAAAIVLSREQGGNRPLVTIGKDTRISSDLLEGALIAGLCSSGADVLSLGVIPTPAVAFLTVDAGAQAAALAIDSMDWCEIVGTIAGDDTIFVLVRNRDMVGEIVGKFKKLMK